MDYSRTTLTAGSVDATEFAVSIDINLAFLNGLGVRVAYDWLQSDGTTLDTIGLGVSYSFR